MQPVAETTLFGPFHRLSSPTQTAETARLQQQSSEIWGQAAVHSRMPSVKAFYGRLLEGRSGVEFYTPVRPTNIGLGNQGSPVYWYRGDPGVQDVNDEFVK